MKVTYLGTTMLLFDDGEDQILFDCHITRPSMISYMFRKLKTDKDVADKVLYDFPMDRLKAIFISHSHFDHVLDMPYFAKKTNADVYGSYSTMNVARGGNISEDKLHSYDDAMNYTIGNYHITIIPSIHSKAHWYNNDLGQIIERPVIQPANHKDYKEGNSFDFFIENNGKTYLIRPSYNYLRGQLDHINADVLFLGVGTMSKDTEENKEIFYKETIDKVNPQIVIPVHWDNFFHPLYGKILDHILIMDNSALAMKEVKQYCEQKNIQFVLMQPLTFRDF